MASKACNWVQARRETTSDVENEDVSLEALRGRNPPSPARRRDSPGLVPPPHKDDAREPAEAAAKSAVIGFVRALEEKDPKMVAARTAQAIAVAASTSRNHAGLVAAATAVESAALIDVENTRTWAPYGLLTALVLHAIKATVDAALAADGERVSTASPPLNIRNADASKQRQLPLLSELPPGSPVGNAAAFTATATAAGARVRMFILGEVWDLHRLLLCGRVPGTVCIRGGFGRVGPVRHNVCGRGRTHVDVGVCRGRPRATT